MDFRNWIDGRRIEGYCTRKGYTDEEILDICEMHRLHHLFPEGSPGGTFQDALKAMVQATPSQKAFLREASRKGKDPRFGHAFIRLAESPEYANRILAAYLNDVKPALDL